MKRGAGDACVTEKLASAAVVSVRLRAGRAHCSRWAVRVSIRPVPPVTWPLPALPAFLCFCSGAALGFSLVASFGFSTASSACVRHAPGRAAAAMAVSGRLARYGGGGFGRGRGD